MKQLAGMGSGVFAYLTAVCNTQDELSLIKAFCQSCGYTTHTIQIRAQEETWLIVYVYVKKIPLQRFSVAAPLNYQTSADTDSLHVSHHNTLIKAQYTAERMSLQTGERHYVIDHLTPDPYPLNPKRKFYSRVIYKAKFKRSIK